VCSSDLTFINKKTGNRVHAIIPVHLYGYPADMDALGELVKRYNLKVIEDATEALGSRYHGKPIGGLGSIGCFSFNGNKIITTGGGGMLTTNSHQLARRAKYITTQARDNARQYYHSEIGYNYRLTNLQAAVGLAQLEKLDDYINKKRRNAFIYNQLLKNIKGIHLPQEGKEILWNYWMYPIHIDKKQFGISKEELSRCLASKGVQTGNYFIPLCSLPPYRGFCNNTITVAKKLHAHGLLLPSSVNITKGEQEKISSIIKEYHIKKEPIYTTY
jgi:perosamine synthetase